MPRYFYVNSEPEGVSSKKGPKSVTAHAELD